MASISCLEIVKSYPGSARPTLNGLTLEVDDGELLVVLGARGSGKSTLLRVIAGMEKVTSGELLLGDRNVTNLPGRERDVAMVVEDQLPQRRKSVRANLESTLADLGVPRHEQQARTMEIAHLMDLTEILDSKVPHLSTGQRQRVALSCAIIAMPQVILMDDPLANIDEQLVPTTRRQIKSLQRGLGVTTVYATRNQAEAMMMADRIAVLHNGILEQCDSPRRLYDQPNNRFVAGLIGSPPMNLMTGRIVEGGVKIGDYTVPMPREVLANVAESAIELGVRPERGRISLLGNGVSLRVESVDDIGPETVVQGSIEMGDGMNSTVAVKVSETKLEFGDRVRLSFALQDLHLFSRTTGERIPIPSSLIPAAGKVTASSSQSMWDDDEARAASRGTTVTLPPPEFPPGRRAALVLATTTYIDPSLRAMRAPATDAADFAATLAEPAIGGFDVETVIDASAQEWRIAIEDFLSQRLTDDVLSVYVSCHGITDQRRRLYFAATDTTKTRLAATGVPAQYLVERLEECRARSQVVILDCCFSGAFMAGAKGEDDVGLDDLTQPGRGRVVLTASNSREYSFEGGLAGVMTGTASAAPGSVFTSALLGGLRDGSADRDRDGFVSVDEAYDHAYEAVRAQGADQTPQRSVAGEGKLLLARNPNGRRVMVPALPRSIRDMLGSRDSSALLKGLDDLGQLLNTGLYGESLSAARELASIVKSDNPQIADRARALLSGSIWSEMTFESDS